MEINSPGIQADDFALKDSPPRLVRIWIADGSAVHQGFLDSARNVGRVPEAEKRRRDSSL
jgi:hypothetical protein